MIVDCYTHAWESPDELGRAVPPRDTARPSFWQRGAFEGAGFQKHWTAAQPADVTIVVGFKSRFVDAEISNEKLAAYVASHEKRLVGFAGIDPADSQRAIEEMQRTSRDLKLAGVAVAPAAQGYHPTDSRAMLVYAEAAKLGLPVLFHTGVHPRSAAKLEYAQPVLLDEVARELPDLRIVIAHLGFPWVNETLMLLAKHEHVFAETSWVLHQPWQAYTALLSAYQFGVVDKLLFGSGFPYASVSQCIEEIYGVNQLVHGTSLPTVPREHLRGIVERDALRLLGIPHDAPAPASAATAPADDDETGSF